MKKKLIWFVLVALLVAMLSVACSGETNPPKDVTEYGYVTFGHSSERKLTTQYEIESYENLYWYYSAVKKDSYGSTGSTGSSIAKIPGNEANSGKGLDGTVGPFSQGAWEYTLYAYNSPLTETSPGFYAPLLDNSLIYKSEAVPITLRGGETKTIPVSVSPQGTTGKVSLKDVFFRWNENLGGTTQPIMELSFVGNKSDNNFKIQSTTELFPAEHQGEDNSFKLTNGFIPFKYTEQDALNYNIPVDYYTVTAKAYLPENESTPLVEQVFGLRVYGNATTVITGDIIEGVDSYVSFDVVEQEMKVFEPANTGATVITMAATPVSKPENKTTVSFEEGALTSNPHQLDVKVYESAAAGSKFVIEGKQAVVGAIDLSLTRVTSKDGSVATTPVSSFESGKAVTITTYIATGLENVSVRYNGDGAQPTLVSYNNATGELKFSTTHFSEFYVVADSDAVNITRNIGYSTLNEAVKSAGKGDVIQMMKDVKLMERVNIVDGIEVVIDFNNKTISSDDIPFHVMGGKVEFAGVGTVKISEKGKSPIHIEGSRDDIANYSVVTIGKDIVFDGGLAGIFIDYYEIKDIRPYGIVVNLNGNTMNVINHGVYINGTMNVMTGNITKINMNNVKITSQDNGIYAAGYAEYILNNCTITAKEALSLKSGTFTINGGVFSSSGAYNEPSEDTSNGSVNTGASLSMTSNDGYAKKLDVTVNDGKFVSTNGYAVYEGIPNAPGSTKPVAAESYVTLKINGGEFVGSTDKAAIKLISIKDKQVVAGGTFNSDPSEYLALGKTVQLINGMYKVEDIDISWYDDNKTEFTITTKEQLIGFEKLINQYKKNFDGKIVKLGSSINMTDVNWTPIKVDGYHGAGIVTINGNNNKITNLNAPLFAGGFAGTSGIVINDLTIAESKIESANTQGIGAFIECVDSMPKIELVNCHLVDSSIKATGANNASRVGGLIGWTSGYDKQNDGPVRCDVRIENCSVERCSLEGIAGSVGGIIGHAGANPNTFHAITGCTIKDTKIGSIDSGAWRVGVVVGTANVGEVTIANTIESGNTLTQTGKTAPDHSNLYGRFVSGETGKLIIDGTEIK